MHRVCCLVVKANLQNSKFSHSVRDMSGQQETQTGIFSLISGLPNVFILCSVYSVFYSFNFFLMFYFSNPFCHTMVQCNVLSFPSAAHMIVERRHQQQQMYSLANSSGSLPSTPHSSRSHPFGPFPPPGPGHYHHHSSNHSNSQHVHPPTPSGVRKTRDGSGKDGGGGGGGGVTGRDGPMQTSPTSTPNFARKSRRKSNIFTVTFSCIHFFLISLKSDIYCLQCVVFIGTEQ